MLRSCCRSDLEGCGSNGSLHRVIATGRGHENRASRRWRGVGVPVCGADGTAVASLSVATIEPRMTDALLRLNPRFDQGDVRRLLTAKND